MSKSAVWSVIVVFFFGIIGSILTFLPPRLIASSLIGFGRHNDRVLIGILSLIIAAVGVYKLLTLVWEYEHPKSKAKKPAKTAKKK